jgi:signal transduction histidine kinase
MLSAKIAHELKNPLSAIKMLVQVCIRSPGHPESQERLEVVEREVRHIEETLRDYLRFSHPLDRLEVESTSLATLTDDVFAVLAGRALEARVKLQRQGDVQAEVDRQRIEEALLNLVANAIEASRGGSIVVAISQSGGEAHLSVRDDGLGMSPGVLAKIGTPFFTTRPQGTGLGVTLARAAFVHHGGRLEYQSAPGAGTTVTGTLPLAGPPMGS